MQKRFRGVINGAPAGSAVTPRQPIQQTVLEGVILFRAGAIFHDAHAKSARLPKLRQRLARVMTEMVRQRKPNPIFAEMPRLIASKIWQSNHDDTAGPQKSGCFLQNGAGIGQMFERIPARDRIELVRWPSSRYDVAIMNPV